jgi:hypothetical protein
MVERKSSSMHGYHLKLLHAFGANGKFENMIELEDFLLHRIGMKEGLDYRLYCQRDAPIPKTDVDHEYQRMFRFYAFNKLDIDQEIDELDIELLDLKLYDPEMPGMSDSEDEDAALQKKKLKELERKKGEMKPWEMKKKRLSEMKIKRMQLAERYTESLKQLKEIKFIEELEMDKEIVFKLDIPQRIKLEEIFPELRQFYILCFKPDSSVQRRAFIYHKKDNEKEYMEVMKSLLTEHHRKFNNNLNSVMKISFRGKYVVKIHTQIYRNFQPKIKSILREYGVKEKVVETNLKIELHLQGNQDNPRRVEQAYDDIVDLLRVEEFAYSVGNDGKGKKDLFEYYALFCSEGEDLIAQINNMHASELLIELYPKQRRITLRGIDKMRDWAINHLRDQINIFNGRVEIIPFHLEDPQAFLRERKKIEEAAMTKGLYIGYSVNDRNTLNIYSHRDMLKKRFVSSTGKENPAVESFKPILKNLVEQSHLEILKSRQHRSSAY